MIFRQMQDIETSTFTYILGDRGEGIIIDPVIENVDRDLSFLSDLNLKLKYCLETHVHADHITGSGNIRSKTGAQIAIGARAGVACADVQLEDGDVIRFGSMELKALYTPGHTAGCMSYYIPGFVFTGDTLFVRRTGRTDFQGGSSENLYDSIMNKLYTLPEETIVYPAHNYSGIFATSIDEEKRLNSRISQGVNKSDFITFMSSLDLPYPKKFDVAVPANMRCGD